MCVFISFNLFLLIFMCVHACVLSHFSHVQLFVTLWIVAHQAPLSMGFSRQEYCSGFPCPSLGGLPHPWVETAFPALQSDSLPTELPGTPAYMYTCVYYIYMCILYIHMYIDFMHMFIYVSMCVYVRIYTHCFCILTFSTLQCSLKFANIDVWPFNYPFMKLYNTPLHDML